MSVLGNFLQILDVWGMVSEYLEKDREIKGSICYPLYAEGCEEGNQKVARQFLVKPGDYVELDLQINAGGFDNRLEYCGGDYDNKGYDYDVPQSALVIPVALSEEDCQPLVIAFSREISDASIVRVGGGGTEFRISGRFLVSEMPLTGTIKSTGEDIPKPDYKYITKLEKHFD